MFGWLSSACPLNTYEKTWTEWRMRWLADTLGIDRLLQAEVLLPTDEFFPEPYEMTESGARRILDRLCCYMGVDGRHLQFEVWTDEKMSAAGHYDRTEQTFIRVAESQLANPMFLVATLAHELAHEILLGGKHFPEDAYFVDHEQITDLLPVFLGAGVFAANANLYEDHTTDYWIIGRQGYLPARMFGYAMALFAFVRDDRDTSWAKYLRPDAAGPFKQGLRYLRKGGDSLFHPDTIRDPRKHLTAGEAIKRLETGSPSVRLATLWELQDPSLTGANLMAAIAPQLLADDAVIAVAACVTLRCHGNAAIVALPQLFRVLRHGDDEVRAAALKTFTAIDALPEGIIPEVIAMVEDAARSNRRDAKNEQFYAGMRLLKQFGRSATAATRLCLIATRDGLISHDSGLTITAVKTLIAVSPDPEREVRSFFEDAGPELRNRALEWVREELAKADAAENA